MARHKKRTAWYRHANRRPLYFCARIEGTPLLSFSAKLKANQHELPAEEKVPARREIGPSTLVDPVLSLQVWTAEAGTVPTLLHTRTAEVVGSGFKGRRIADYIARVSCMWTERNSRGFVMQQLRICSCVCCLHPRTIVCSACITKLPKKAL